MSRGSGSSWLTQLPQMSWMKAFSSFMSVRGAPRAAGSPLIRLSVVAVLPSRPFRDTYNSTDRQADAANNGPHGSYGIGLQTHNQKPEPKRKQQHSAEEVVKLLVRVRAGRSRQPTLAFF